MEQQKSSGLYGVSPHVTYYILYVGTFGSTRCDMTTGSRMNAMSLIGNDSVSDSTVIAQENVSDALTIGTQSIVTVDMRDKPYVTTRAGNVSNVARADRMRQVGDRLSLGMSTAEIARDMDIDIATAKRDVEAWSILLKAPTDIETLRKTQTLKMMEVQETARDRYINDGIPVEGRLMIDASARIGKMHGLDETEATQAIGGALAGLLASLGSGDEE